MLPFAPGITGNYTKKGDELSLELRSSRNLSTKTFTTKDPTVINTVEQDFSSILEDYLGDNLPGFSDVFFEMMECPLPVDGEEREIEIFSDIKMKFCWIPAGEAQLGSPKEEQDYVTKTFYDDERPEFLDTETESARGKFKTQGFWMGKYEVTQIQWEAVTGKNPSHFKGENLPVENVSWDDCQDFINKCNASGLRPQLPHEDQWEYACRGGKGNKQAFYWGNELNGDKANCIGTVPYGNDKKGRYLGKTTEVGSYEKASPHPWGLCDVHGNVWEWCDNWYVGGNLHRAIRGGCCFSDSWGCRSSYRHRAIQKEYYCFLGFRLIIC